MHLIFVCTGNTCRSPLAEAAWRAFGESGVTASSAGVSAPVGLPVATHSARVAQSWGEDLSQHRARRLSPALARGADYLIGMTGDHVRELRRQFPDSKVLQLGNFVAPGAASGGTDAEAKANSALAELSELQSWFIEMPDDILDPIGGSLEAYQACGEHIKRAVQGLAQALRDGRLP